MNKYRVYVSWTVVEQECFMVEAENEDEAADMMADNDMIGEDYEVDRIVDLGEIEIEPVREPEDPNQLKMEMS